MLEKAITEGRQRGDHYLELEVISANEAAVRLYEKTGFELIQDLYGFSREAGGTAVSASLEEVDLLKVAHLVAAAGAHDLPWQLSAETLACYGPPMKAFHLDRAYAVISNPSKPAIALMSVIVEPDKRGAGRARRLLSALMASYEDRDFKIPALCPAEFDPLFKSIGFERSELSQHHMRLNLQDLPSNNRSTG
jgi:GNAT superfamily N-acetyltransferase